MFQRQITMQAATGDGGAGGGDAPAPTSVTIEQVNELVNKALGARDKRFETKVTEMFGNFGKTLEDRLAAMAPKAPEEQPQGDKKVDPELVKLRQMFEAQNKVLEAEKSARLAAEAKSRSEKAAAQLQSTLGKHVRPEAASVLIKAFRADIEFDGDEPTLPLPDGSGRTSIEAAIAAWAKSDDAKAFVPAPSSGGSGAPRAVSAAGSRATRDPTTVPASQWTTEDRAEMIRRNQAEMAERQAKNPLGFG